MISYGRRSHRPFGSLLALVAATALAACGSVTAINDGGTGGAAAGHSGSGGSGSGGNGAGGSGQGAGGATGSGGGVGTGGGQGTGGTTGTGGAKGTGGAGTGGAGGANGSPCSPACTGGQLCCEEPLHSGSDGALTQWVCETPTASACPLHP